jgi:hypothetical protein
VQATSEDLDGFRAVFLNDWGISVQWGPGTCATVFPEDKDFLMSTAEIAVLQPGESVFIAEPLGGPLLDGITGGSGGDQIIGYCTFDQVLMAMDIISGLPSDVQPETAAQVFAEAFAKQAV